MDIMDKLQFQPTYIKYLEFTEEEFETKLNKTRGIISFHIATNFEEKMGRMFRYEANAFGDSMEKIIFEKIRTNEISKRVFLDWFNSNQVEGTNNLKKIDFFNVSILMRNVSNENLGG